MDAHTFVERLRTEVGMSAVASVLSNLRRPPGRRPRKDLRNNAQWYSKLSREDRAAVQRIIEQAVDHTLFGVLCVFDGVRAIEPPPKGELRVEYVEATGRTTVLNKEYLLHELYAGIKTPIE